MPRVSKKDRQYPQNTTKNLMIEQQKYPEKGMIVTIN